MPVESFSGFRSIRPTPHKTPPDLYCLNSVNHATSIRPITGELSGEVIVPVGYIYAIFPNTRAITDAVKGLVEIRKRRVRTVQVDDSRRLIRRIIREAGLRAVRRASLRFPPRRAIRQSRCFTAPVFEIRQLPSRIDRACGRMAPPRCFNKQDCVMPYLLKPIRPAGPRHGCFIARTDVVAKRKTQQFLANWSGP